jgi:serum/glucocorticoid-regulated kinase 2
LQGNKAYEKFIDFNNEPVVFSDTAIKINMWGIKQERILLMTTNHIFNFKKKTMKRKIAIEKIGAIITSLKNSKELVLHVPSEYDYRYQVNDRDVFVSLLKREFVKRRPNGHLRYYCVKGGLKEVTTTEKDAKYKISRLPGDEMREKDEEVYGPDYHQDDSGEASSPDGTFDKKFKDAEQRSLETAVDDTEDDGDADFDRNSVLVFAHKEEESKVTLKDFEVMGVIGRGTFGKVFLAKLKTTEVLYAIKSLRKDVLVEAGQIENVKLEKEILLACDHPFLAGMEYVFQSETRLYFVIEFLRGGELYKHFLKKRRFQEEEAKFYAAQICMAIGHLHKQNILHRDLKLENIMINGDGYVKVIDFGLAKIINNDDLAMSFCGTPEYLAPEMVKQEGHDRGVDWWSLGILIYEMTIGVTPFFSKSRLTLINNIKKEDVIFPDKKKYKIDYSDDFVDVVLKLLDKDKKKRLGSADDMDEILAHPYFKSIDLDSLLKKEIKPPYIPEFTGKEDMGSYIKLKTGSKDVSDTMIPSNKLKKIKKHESDFSNF